MRNMISSALALSAIFGAMIANTTVAEPAATGAPMGAARAFGESDRNREMGPSISTAFGVYRPYAIPAYRLLVGAGEPAIAANFSNVAVADARFPWNSYFTSGERALLQANGFLVRPEAIGSFAQAYAADLGPEPMGSFVTVDAVLHGLRVTMAEARRDMERNYAAPALGANLGDLAGALAERLDVERNTAIAASLKTLLAYVQTAHRLISPSAPVDPRVADIVAAELKKISGAEDALPSSVFPRQTIDYAMFAPRGYYTLDAQLAGYYRAHAWLSRSAFGLPAPGAAFDIASIRDAALLARMTSGLQNAEDFRRTLENINVPAAFFGDRGEAIVSWDLLSDALGTYYGRIVEAGPGFLADEQMLSGFARYLGDQFLDAGADRGSKIVFRMLEPIEASLPEMYAQVWKERRSTRGDYGLAVMAAAGSPRAAELLGARSSFEQHEPMALGGSMMESMQELDGALLYTLHPLLQAERGEGFPRFARSAAWSTRELASALGAWADFRREPATTAMRGVARAGRVGVAGGRMIEGYVEPAPEAWARIASLAGYLRNGLLESRGERLIGRAVETKLRDIENVSAGLMQIAAVELSGAELSAQQIDLLRAMRERIAAYETFADKGLQGDGYTSVAGGSDLGGGIQIANGHPLAIYVVAPRNDGEEGLMLVRGAVYSYYETESETGLAALSKPGSSIAPDARLREGYVSADRPFAQDPTKFIGVTAAVPQTAATYTPTRSERIAAIHRADLRLETTVIGLSDNELWFTVQAPNLEGYALRASIADRSGQVLRHAEIGQVRNGERLDVFDVGRLGAGEYHLRVLDAEGTVLATARFRVIR